MTPASPIGFDACLDFTLREEGGFTDDPEDPGGATNCGITLATLSHWEGRACSAADVRALTPAIAAPIYRAQYWNALRCWSLPPGLDLMVFDFGVNAGPGRAAVQLQQAVGAMLDGVVGPLTAVAARGAGAGRVIARLHDTRASFYRALPGFPRFGAGWLGRLERCASLANRMATGAAA